MQNAGKKSFEKRLLFYQRRAQQTEVHLFILNYYVSPFSLLLSSPLESLCCF